MGVPGADNWRLSPQSHRFETPCPWVRRGRIDSFRYINVYTSRSRRRQHLLGARIDYRRRARIDRPLVLSRRLSNDDLTRPSIRAGTLAHHAWSMSLNPPKYSFLLRAADQPRDRSISSIRAQDRNLGLPAVVPLSWTLARSFVSSSTDLCEVQNNNIVHERGQPKVPFSWCRCHILRFHYRWGSMGPNETAIAVIGGPRVISVFDVHGCC